MHVVLLRTYKVQVSAAGVQLTINGQTFELGATADGLLFDLQRACAGYTVPEPTVPYLNAVKESKP